MKRREFLKSSVAGSVALAGGAIASAEGPMPMRTLGKSGLQVSHFCLGGFHMAKGGPKNATEVIHRAVDLGVNFFDSAHKYHSGLSDEFLGHALQDGKRQKVLLMSKAELRDRDGAMAQLEDTLRRMKTDYLDLWQCHEVARMDEVEKIFGPSGSLEAFVKAKKEGKVRHIGFTGHHDPAVHLALLNGFDGWETVQHPVNLVDPHYLSFVKNVLPKVKAKGLGKIAMKTNAMGPILDNKIATIAECLRFAMAQGPDVICSGVETVEQLEQNVAVIKHQKPFTDSEITDLLTRTGKGKIGPDIEWYKKKNA
ncbi:MAG: aldo/keto reductase [Acidobacteria bacterium]|nr:aldo/keto reductase [Acidobacteriota bacterium]